MRVAGVQGKSQPWEGERRGGRSGLGGVMQEYETLFHRPRCPARHAESSTCCHLEFEVASFLPCSLFNLSLRFAMSVIKQPFVACSSNC
jgi:hypothetical protein